MYYHCVAVLGGKERYHRWWNRSEEKLITGILGPFLRGQIIPSKWRERPGFLNLGAVDHFMIFRTKNKLNRSEILKFKKNNRIGANCTVELMKEIRLDKAMKQAKSLMQRLMLPPEHQIFVIMKFDDEHLDSAYKGVIRPLAEKFGYKVVRIDEVEDSGSITAQIMESIAESEIVLADLTGGRPNCYYETGVAYATGRELILSIKEGEEIHFDLATNRFIKWRTENDLREQLRDRLSAIEEQS